MEEKPKNIVDEKNIQASITERIDRLVPASEKDKIIFFEGEYYICQYYPIDTSNSGKTVYHWGHYWRRAKEKEVSEPRTRNKILNLTEEQLPEFSNSDIPKSKEKVSLSKYPVTMAAYMKLKEMKLTRDTCESNELGFASDHMSSFWMIMSAMARRKGMQLTMDEIFGMKLAEILKKIILPYIAIEVSGFSEPQKNELRLKYEIPSTLDNLSSELREVAQNVLLKKIKRSQNF